MNALVVYDSQYGNTEKIARAIGAGLGGVPVKLAHDVVLTDLEGLKLLVVGAPTQGGRPTQAVKDLLERIPARGLAGMDVAAFDTRLSFADSNFALKLVMRMVGYAAPRIGGSLRKKGGRLVAEPEGFIVGGKEGPLREGEEERAMAWARGLPVSVSAAAGARA